MGLRQLSDGSFAEQVYIPAGVTVNLNGSLVQLSDGTFATKVVPVGSDGSVGGQGFAKASGLWYPLKSSNSAVSCPADTTEDVLATITMAAGSMGANGLVRIRTLWTVTNSANNKTIRVRLGGASGTQFLTNTLTTSASAQMWTIIGNRNSQSSQVAWPAASGAVFGNTTAAVTTGAIDTSAAVDIIISGQKASSGETLTLEAYDVDVLYKV